jgi:SRSO17 transposase
MTILEHPEAQAILEDAVITEEDLLELAERIQPFLSRYLPLFQRSEQRANASIILQGKLSALSRKTCEPIAHLFGVRRENLQDFVGVSPWEDPIILSALRQHVREAWTDATNAVFTCDTSGFPKKGIHSCGVKRQWCGHLGKVDSCQIGVYLGYACSRGHTLIDHRLFLPKEWTEDQERREKTGIPEEIVYQETWEILLEMIGRRGKEMPHSWVTADSEFGRVYQFRKGLRQRSERYVVDGRNDMKIRDLQAPPPERKNNRGPHPLPPEMSIQEWIDSRPAEAWQRLEIRDGEKGPLQVEAAQSQVRTFDESRTGDEERLVVIRTLAGNPEPRLWATLSNTRAEDVPLKDVVWAHAQRYWQEASFKEAKSEIGMDEYEVRGWRGWHHHMTMSLLALWFLVSEKDRVKKKTPAMTVSILREAFSRLIMMSILTLAVIARELNATLHRKETARIYHWMNGTKQYPPRREREGQTTARLVITQTAANPPSGGASSGQPGQPGLPVPHLVTP